MHIHFVFSFRRDFSSPVRLIILILVPAKHNDVKLYIFKSDTKISEQKKFSSLLSVIVRVSIVLKRTVVVDND